MSVKPFVVSDFDSRRLRESFVASEHGGNQLWEDPQFPGFIVKDELYTEEQVTGRTVSAADCLDLCVRHNYTELACLVLACPELVVPANFIVTEPAAERKPNFYGLKVDNDNIFAFQYVQKLRGSIPNPYVPAHRPFLRALAAGQLTYLEQTAVGDGYRSEFLHPTQYMIGQVASRRLTTPRLFIVDIQPPSSPELCFTRDGAPESPDTHISYEETVHDVTRWILEMPTGPNVEELKERARVLRVANGLPSELQEQ